MHNPTHPFTFARNLSAAATTAPFFQSLLKMKREREQRALRLAIAAIAVEMETLQDTQDSPLRAA